jgi:hypothetical protein
VESQAVESSAAKTRMTGKDMIDGANRRTVVVALRKSIRNLVSPLRVQTSTVKKSAATITSQCRRRNHATWSSGSAPVPVPGRAP